MQTCNIGYFWHQLKKQLPIIYMYMGRTDHYILSSTGIHVYASHNHHSACVNNHQVMAFSKPENHFRSYFSPFQINTQFLLFKFWFHKMTAGVHFGSPKITFDRTSRHFRSICNFYFCNIFQKMAAIGHFRCPRITFDRISDQLKSIHNIFCSN